ncbi:DUF3892 domain-containing protein (plasmid) [Streptomyces sp. L7]|uniref:DUF3892 domain-containing protein n=1 Tax=Streptomyces sp. L7 TaxID=3423954 RepID=UPI000E20ACC9|nr:hypothetical protein DOE76_14665 [Leifsonia sp. ku-ls]
MYEITAIKVSRQPPTLGAITDYYFQGRGGEPNQWVSKPNAVTYVANNPSTVYVSGAGATVFVEVVSGQPDYLRTQGDGTSSDNLLSLPIH